MKLIRIGIYCDQCSLQGIPLAFVLTGRRPSTTIESLTLIESHNITKLNEPDFRHINQNAYPVVFAYNGRDHFAPTIPCTTAQFLEWKTKKELGSLLGASLHVSAQLDQHTLPPELSAAYKEVQACIARNLPVISKAGLQHFKQLNMQHCSTHRGPAIQPSASGIPEASGQQDLSSAQSVPSTSEADSTTEKERGRAGFKCAECGVVKYRKPDFEGHLWSKHGLGDPIVCNRGTCGGKSYSSASSLRQHIRTIHQGQYKFNCDRCDYGTDNYDCLTSHKARKHRVRQKTPNGRVIVFACKKCKKEFDAPHLLRKHETNQTCTRKKTIPCPDCTRFYKTKEGLQYHQEQQHKGKKSPCSICGKMVSEKAMPNHQKQHSSERAVQRAKDFVAKAQRRKRAFAFSSQQLAKRKIAARKKSGASKSTPAKIRKSPKGRRT